MFVTGSVGRVDRLLQHSVAAGRDHQRQHPPEGDSAGLLPKFVQGLVDFGGGGVGKVNDHWRRSSRFLRIAALCIVGGGITVAAIPGPSCAACRTLTPDPTYLLRRDRVYRVRPSSRARDRGF